jgi:hypothetical protein
VQLPVLNAWRPAHTLQTSLNYMQQHSTCKTCLRSASYTLHCFQNQKRKFFSALPSAIDENTKTKTWHLVTSRLKFMVFKGHAKCANWIISEKRNKLNSLMHLSSHFSTKSSQYLHWLYSPLITKQCGKGLQIGWFMLLYTSSLSWGPESRKGSLWNSSWVGAWESGSI